MKDRSEHELSDEYQSDNSDSVSGFVKKFKYAIMEIASENK
jgi:hypothetical protein